MYVCVTKYISLRWTLNIFLSASSPLFVETWSFTAQETAMLVGRLADELYVSIVSVFLTWGYRILLPLLVFTCSGDQNPGPQVHVVGTVYNGATFQAPGIDFSPSTFLSSSQDQGCHGLI